ncbi:uncharacterized protein [Nicotiana tomentosiformis]|uniref:uncharacterized protein n=1 Tax=Nicotiana tomentosiformis TaxID=4098 RepID=UPI00388CD06F
MHANVAHVLFQAVGDITGFTRGKFSFTYLGCPIFYTRRRKHYYDYLIKKVKAKLHSWKGKLLSFGGKTTLITSVLQSMPVHLLSMLDPPNNMLEHLHKVFARFFWSTKEEGRIRHWSSWQNLCLPKEEGGLEFRSLHDVSRSLFAKLWWRFRTTKSLWSNFMWNFSIDENLQEVIELRQGGAWNEKLIDQSFPEDIADHIKHNVHYDGSEEYWDIPYWMPTSSGKFIRLWRHKLSTDDLWRRQGFIHVLRCWCCQHPQEETFDHIFLTNPTASKVWKLFLGAAWINVLLVQVKQVEAPTIITWELWKKRNTGRNGRTVSTNRVIHEVNKILHYLAMVRYPWLSHILVLWPDTIQFFEAYKPIWIIRKVTWQLPHERWYKCNTDDASKGNPGPSSLGFCARDDAGDLVYARAVDLGVTTNVVAEAKAIL